MIKIEDITKHYGTDENPTIALEHISVNIPEHKFVTITGKSGSGKTTLLNILGLLDCPDYGKIIIKKKNILNYNRKQILFYRRNLVGIVFQFFQLIPVLNVKENIIIANEFANKYKTEYFNDIIERLEISDILSKFPDQISGGQKQRVAIARAIINHPRILLADEPTGNLDSENSEKVISLLKELSRDFGTTVIIVTHDEEIAQDSDFNIHLVDGRVGGITP